MKAVRLIAPGRSLETCELPFTQPAPGEPVVRMRAAGICHLDMHYYTGRSPVEPRSLTLVTKLREWWSGAAVAFSQATMFPNISSRLACDRRIS